jgi:hypothetical protein
MTLRNPELRRYAWLELSTHRLVALPLVLAIIFFVADQMKGAMAVASAAVFIYVLLIAMWGGHKAAEAMLDEINDNTWDYQRLSALSPDSLAIGKLVGSTLYTWYGGLLCLAA